MILSQGMITKTKGYLPTNKGCDERGGCVFVKEKINKSLLFPSQQAVSNAFQLISGNLFSLHFSYSHFWAAVPKGMISRRDILRGEIWWCSATMISTSLVDVYVAQGLICKVDQWLVIGRCSTYQKDLLIDCTITNCRSTSLFTLLIYGLKGPVDRQFVIA